MFPKSKLTSVRVDACKKYYKDINVLRDNAAFEQQQMEDELKEINSEDHESFELLDEGKIPANAMREQFSVPDADDSLSIDVSVSEKVDPSLSQNKEIYP